MSKVQDWATKIINSVETAFYGKTPIIEKLLVSILCRGHILLEDIPGVGKTIVARAMSASLGGVFSRIQCTPDLLPADILGVSIFDPKSSSFTFKEGPILANIVLVDEINRATPRTQSALLEAMAENQITVEGKTRQLPRPFFLIATENPVDYEGTFPLPEAQKDRFLMSLDIGYPARDSEAQILESQRRTTHPVEDVQNVTSIEEVTALQEEIAELFVHKTVKDYILDLIEATRNNKYLKLGVSPRGSLSLYKSAQALAAIRGRDYVVPEDVKELALPVCSTRVIVKSEYLIKGITAKEVLNEIFDSVPLPVLEDAR